ncbi:MAG: tetratricopeptide repeat protein [Ardenticatenaceae bacterium]
MAKARQKRRKNKKNKKLSRARSGLSSQQMLGLESESLKGFKALENEEYESAEDHFKRALKIGVTTNAVYGLGTVYMKQERYDEAHRVFADLVKMAPNNALYWYTFGAVCMHKEETSAALDALKKARRLCSPDDYELRDEIKTLLKSIDQFSDIELQEHSDIDRKTYLEQEERYQRGIKLQEEGKIEEALEEFEAYLEIEPNFYRALGNAGTCLLALGELDEGEKMLRRALEIKPDYELARYNLKALSQARKSGSEPEIVIVNSNRDKPLDKQIAEELKRKGVISKDSHNNNQESGFPNYYYIIGIVAVVLLLTLLGYWFMG